MRKTLLLCAILILLVAGFTQCAKELPENEENPNAGDEYPSSVTDIDGNVYETVKIGEQLWMRENLKTTTLNDGQLINEYAFTGDWAEEEVNALPYYQWADLTDLSGLYVEERPSDFYGAMYNETAITSSRLAPEGWRIATYEDFIELEGFLSDQGHLDEEARALKTSFGWNKLVKNGRDAVGFHALPNGFISSEFEPTPSQFIATWATTDVDAAGNRMYVSLFDRDTMLFVYNPQIFGGGVRCIKE